MMEFKTNTFFVIYGTEEAKLLAQRLIEDESMLYCLEPHPDDQWCFYVREENHQRLIHIASEVIEEVR